MLLTIVLDHAGTELTSLVGYLAIQGWPLSSLQGQKEERSSRLLTQHSSYFLGLGEIRVCKKFQKVNISVTLKSYQEISWHWKFLISDLQLTWWEYQRSAEVIVSLDLLQLLLLKLFFNSSLYLYLLAILFRQLKGALGLEVLESTMAFSTKIELQCMVYFKSHHNSDTELLLAKRRSVLCDPFTSNDLTQDTVRTCGKLAV